MPAMPPPPPSAPPVPMAPADLNAALLRHFGHDRFRPGQEAIVRSVLSGQPTIAILPTGGGKSLCYQLPALLLPGTTVVASPLVALMKDQVDQLNARGVAATFINSSIGESERQERQAKLRRGEWKIVYVAPERFRSSSFLSALSQQRIPLLAVDEAHCISSWGHDFRPDYARLQEARAVIQAERVLALTATATAEVRADIAKALGLADPRVFVAGFDRPNLFLESVRASGDNDKLARLAALARTGGPGLVYAATRRNVEKIVAALRARGLDAIGYHAGMNDDARSAAQDRFLRDGCDVIVATNAFGMGVDKPNIRYVVHFDVPRTVEAWYQEIGRAGRDGNESTALLLFNFADVMLQRRLIDGARASEDVVRAALAGARRLRSGSIDALARTTGLSPQELQPALRVLESAGLLERGFARGDGAEFSVANNNGPDSDDLGIDFAMLEKRVMRERRMLDRMVRLVDSNGCRRHELLRYFGDPEAPAKCTACDNCVGPRAPAPNASDTRDRTSGKSRTRRDESGSESTSRSKRSADRAAAPENEEPVDAELFAALRALRTELARAAETPPYVIFHDATLRALCRERPLTKESFLAVKGAGPARWERYGEKVLDVIRRASPAPSGNPLVATPASRPPAPAPPIRREAGSPHSQSRLEPRRESSAQGAPRTAPPRASEAMPGWLAAVPAFSADGYDGRTAGGGDEHLAVRGTPLSARLLTLSQSGRTLAEIADQLSTEPAEIASELAAIASRGTALDIAKLLGAERYAAIRASSAGADGDLVAIRRRLNFPATIGEIRLALM